MNLWFVILSDHMHQKIMDLLFEVYVLDLLAVMSDCSSIAVLIAPSPG